MKVTAKEEYGLRCMLQLARHEHDAEPVTLTQIARREGMSVPHVAKLMTLLRQGGLVESVRGRSGGYVLARPAATVSVLEVLRALGDRLFDSDYCGRHRGLDDASCVHLDACAIRSVWSRVESIASDVLGRTSITDLIASDKRALSFGGDERSQVRLAPLEAAAKGRS